MGSLCQLCLGENGCLSYCPGKHILCPLSLVQVVCVTTSCSEGHHCSLMTSLPSYPPPPIHPFFSFCSMLQSVLASRSPSRVFRSLLCSYRFTINRNSSVKSFAPQSRSWSTCSGWPTLVEGFISRNVALGFLTDPLGVAVNLLLFLLDVVLRLRNPMLIHV